MKKFIYILLAASLAFSSLTACSKSDEKTTSSSENTVSANDAQSRAVALEDIGLYYVTPASWAEYQSTSIYPRSIATEGTVARVIYNYINAEDAQKLADDTADNADVNLDDYLTPICEITVAETNNFKNGTLDYIADIYTSSMDLATQGDYSYTLYYVGNGYEESLSGDDLEIYNILSSTESINELSESVITKEFDPADVKTLAESMGLNEYITFDTQTLEGESITSACFGDYDVTLFNFWGTYAIERSNEQADLQAVYSHYASEGKRVNVINAVIDTPDETAEATVKELKAEAGGEFTTLVMDEILATWATQNLEGVPTTILVDSTGKIASDQIKGAKGAEFYIETIDAYLSQL